ncbi:hypothetical protein CEXT_658831 [Caerostris extrusa]|uniref:Uncharacterized protein n=1 Tax=Caerostris extrusa TaxID=172846 RepID=A0AAV4NI26_CAEEX|nr:hypothetical protein CEXT_658831 [Caerostris extrusa]
MCWRKLIVDLCFLKSHTEGQEVASHFQDDKRPFSNYIVQSLQQGKMHIGLKSCWLRLQPPWNEHTCAHFQMCGNAQWRVSIVVSGTKSCDEEKKDDMESTEASTESERRGFQNRCPVEEVVESSSQNAVETRLSVLFASQSPGLAALCSKLCVHQTDPLARLGVRLFLDVVQRRAAISFWMVDIKQFTSEKPELEQP